MAKKNSNSAIYYESPFNETGTGGPESPDMTGESIYWGGFPQVLNMHLKEEDMHSTPNSRSGEDILGKPAAGEPQAMMPPVKQLAGGK